VIAYGVDFHDLSPLQMELYCVAKGGKWTANGVEYGAGLFRHYMQLRKIIWPNRYCHRWTELLYREFIQNDVTVLMGSASSQKTSHAVEYVLLNYWARPESTLVVLSTVNMDKLDIGVWAELKDLWSAGRALHPSLAGNLLDHKRAITTDDVETSVRDFRKGVICRPCYVGGKFVGLGILAGAKQAYVFYVCDELQFMQEAFSASWPHLFSNGNVKVIGSGNPKHDPEDELGKTAEPKEGWNSHPEPIKTEVWPTKFMGARCVNLVGTDSPNFETPDGQPEPYPKLIGRRFAKRIAHDFGENSFQFYQLVKGVMRVQFARDRVITRALCRQHGAMDQAVWETNQKTGIYGLDPTYGGDDRCIGMPLWFGKDVDGHDIIQVGQYRVFKFDLTSDIPIEDQIAEICAEELKVWNIDPNNLFYDSTGKGTIGAAFARKFGSIVPVAVDSGGKCTPRPVRQDLWVDEPDGSRRLKRCDEYYSKFVSEMWFSVRYCIEANQMRELPEDVMAEGCARIYEVVVGNRIQVEPKTDPKKKEDLKRRLGKSPDLFDCLAIGVEGARQRGFSIARLGNGVSLSGQSDDFFEKESKEWEEALNLNLLNHALPS
jgi:hypothetical protein